MDTVQDRLWLWGHDAGSHNRSWGLPAPSRITPAEAALYMGVPNLIMVRYNDRPAPPFLQYAVPFRALKQVVWSVVGASGTTGAEERAEVLELGRQLPNMSGVMMDDFFRSSHEDQGVGVLTVSELEALIVDGYFQIVKTEDLDQNPPNYFAVAKKPEHFKNGRFEIARE